jgi:hypothetical protein
VLPPLLKKIQGIFSIANIKLTTTNLITNKHSHLMDYSVKENNISLNRSLTLHRVKRKTNKTCTT